MRRAGVILLLLAALAAAGAYALTEPQHLPREGVPPEGDAGAGAQVFAAGGCASCHAAKDAKGDAKRVLSGGQMLKSDFGTFVVPNISPHPRAGIGGWTYYQFADSMRYGTTPDGSHYYPAFPYPSYSRMNERDIADLFAYLQTLPPSDQANPGHELGFPFNIRRALGLWKALYLAPSPVRPLSEDLRLARGQYLVEGPGHCGECHTPRGLLGGLKTDRWLAGGPNPEGKGNIPNITPHEDGLGGWSAEDIAYYLESGFTPDFDSAGGAMVSVIENISTLPAEDREAIAAYLKSVPALASQAAE